MGSDGIVPLHVTAQRADIEQIAAAVFELVAGERNLEPREYQQHCEPGGSAEVRGMQTSRTSVRHCRRLLLVGAESPGFGAEQLYIEIPPGAKPVDRRRRERCPAAYATCARGRISSRAISS
jgi:hypothetical protein